MAKERRKSIQEEPGEESLVPVIEEEERRLQLMLDQARERAEQLVQEAEKSAEERIAAARQRVPSLREERRQSAMVEFQKEADTLRGSTSKGEADLRAAAESGRQEAISKIVESVWPAGR